MNPRLFLLILVTATFMAAWDGDKVAMEAALAQRNNAELARTAVAALKTDTDAVMTCNAPGEPITDEMTEPMTEVPLPARIAAGHYQAVSPSGLTQRVIVTRESSTSDAIREFYTVDDANGHRWFLVRVDPGLRK